MNRRRYSFAIALSLALGATSSIAVDDPQAQLRVLELPRYKKNPVYLFLENFVLDVIGHLPSQKSNTIQSMNLQKVFKTKAVEWRAVLRETLHLSETIDIAILDLWYRNQDIARATGTSYAPEQFAMDFTDEYMKDGSLVDVWPPGALEAAKRRVADRTSKSSLGP